MFDRGRSVAVPWSILISGFSFPREAYAKRAVFPIHGGSAGCGGGSTVSCTHQVKSSNMIKSYQFGDNWFTLIWICIKITSDYGITVGLDGLEVLRVLALMLKDLRLATKNGKQRKSMPAKISLTSDSSDFTQLILDVYLLYVLSCCFHIRQSAFSLVYI